MQHPRLVRIRPPKGGGNERESIKSISLFLVGLTFFSHPLYQRPRKWPDSRTSKSSMSSTMRRNKGRNSGANKTMTLTPSFIKSLHKLLAPRSSLSSSMTRFSALPFHSSHVVRACTRPRTRPLLYKRVFEKSYKCSICLCRFTSASKRFALPTWRCYKCAYKLES